MAYLPQFINSTIDTASQLWILAVTFVVLATLNAAIYAVFAGKAQRVVLSPKTQRLFNVSGGSLLSIAGFWALSAKQS